MNQYVYEPISHRFAWRDMTLRILELNEQIRQKTEGVWQLRRLYKLYHEDGSEAAYVLTIDKSREHGLTVEISAVNGRFTLDFLQTFSNPIFVNAFLKELEENGIVYDLQDVNELELANIKLPWTE